MKSILKWLRQTWTGELPLIGYAAIYILASFGMAVMSVVVLAFGVIGLRGTGLLMAAGMVIGSSVALAGLIGAALFARGLFLKQREMSGIYRLLAWFILAPHTIIALAAAVAFVGLGVGTTEMLWTLWFGDASGE